MPTELTAERIEEAIEEIAESGVYGNQVHQETMETALAALRAEQERSKGCEYCRSGCTINSVTVRSTFLGLCGDGRVKINTTDTIKSPRFCPNCGRRLTEGSAE